MDVEDLEIYQEAMRIGEIIWKEVTGWDFFARDTVGKQLVRCTDSIAAANISEGYGRYHFAENRKFCFYARGSLAETISTLSSDLKTLRKRLNAYIRSIGSRTTEPRDP